MDWKKLQKFIADEDGYLRKFSSTTDTEKRLFARMVKLMEELGELSDAILAHTGRQRKEKLKKHNPAHLAEEFADVIITTLLVAMTAGVDIDEALDVKVKKIKQRRKLK